MEHHLSIFRPYDRDAKHEDQLTRAALIVIKLVPLAQEAFLGLCGCGRLAELPKPRFDMQTGKLAPLAADAEEPEVSDLVSIFLGPHQNVVPSQKPNLASERKAIYDGVIQYGSSLLIVIESKLYASAKELQSLEINRGGLRHKNFRWTLVRWQELLDRWWNLVDHGLLNPAEAEVMSDFFDNAEENFGDLLPYTDLERCGENQSRRARRLRKILEDATGLQAEVRDVLGHAGVKFPDNRVTAIDRVSLFIEVDNLVASVWPAELAPQYKHVYSKPKRAEALVALTNDPAWSVHSNFHLAYWRAAAPRRWYPARHLSGADYVRQWVEDFKTQRAGRRPKEEIHDPLFRDWLIERQYATESEMESLDEWAAKLPMEKFDVRPSIQVKRSWQLSDAVTRDKTGQLVSEVRAAIDEILSALDEPNLDALAN